MAIVVPIDADAQVHLVGAAIRGETRRDRQQRIGRLRLKAGKTHIIVPDLMPE